MRIKVSESLQTTIERAWDIYFDPNFIKDVRDWLEVESFTEIEFEDTPEYTLMHYRLVARRKIPDWAKKILGEIKVAYTSKDIFDKKARELRCTMSSDFTKYIGGEGLWTIEPGEPGHVKRCFEGDIYCKIPIVGRRIEESLSGAIANDFAKSNIMMARWVQRDLDALAAGKPLPTLEKPASMR